MKCPHCSVTVHVTWMTGPILPSLGLPNPRFAWSWRAGYCPACNKAIIYIHQVVPGGAPAPGATRRGASEPSRLVQPRFPARSELGAGVPDELKLDYLEACAVLGISPRASAALSRRILQSVLQQQGYTKHRLVDQVEDVLNETDSSKALPTDLRNNVDVIRKFGNFSAHETVDKATAEIIGVEPEEAEWCLELVEMLFDHYYIRPAVNEARLAEFNNRLQQAGQTPTQS